MNHALLPRLSSGSRHSSLSWCLLSYNSSGHCRISRCCWHNRLSWYLSSGCRHLRKCRLSYNSSGHCRISRCCWHNRLSWYLLSYNSSWHSSLNWGSRLLLSYNSWHSLPTCHQV
jgi:hypothetical protein